jgi:hypothetical protein
VGDGDPEIGRFILDGKAASAMNPEDKAKAFIASFDGGECFLIEPLPGATKPHEYQAVGRTIEPFRRLDSACKREVGVRRTSQYRRSPRSNVPPSISSGLPQDGRQPPG